MLYYSLKKRNIFIHSRNQGNVNKHTVSNGEPPMEQTVPRAEVTQLQSLIQYN